MSILAIDFGRKRIGLALSRSKQLVVPLPGIQLTSARALITDLMAIINEEHVETVVVGHGIMQPALRQWLTVLQHQLTVPVVIAEETSTTNEAQQRVGTTHHHADSAAAAIILERYVEDLLQ